MNKVRVDEIVCEARKGLELSQLTPVVLFGQTVYLPEHRQTYGDLKDLLDAYDELQKTVAHLARDLHSANQMLARKRRSPELECDDE